ncbi:MAG: hypothetical protein CM1200mP2_26780 [Planctomycetaceae bacterium]|nr:MAG: hypothetical protein CM1200mP2_26780 [Planctomycetaceae bacterium]
MLPEFICRIPGLCVGVSAYIELITQRSSANCPTWGNRLLTISPLSPCGRKGKADGASLPMARPLDPICNPPSKLLPWYFSSAGL